jgi:hypothetical protein
MVLSRLIHTASVPAVYASRFGFPYTGKTRFRSGDSPYRMGFEPIRLLQRISSVALSPPIPTLQALPGATMFDVQSFRRLDLLTLKALKIFRHFSGLSGLGLPNTLKTDRVP